MPSVSPEQRALFAIAEHEPWKLHKRNKHLATDMTKSQLHDFAATKDSEMPKKKSKYRMGLK
jgi:hypothetical protein